MLERAILDALATSGKDLDRLAPADLAPVDEFHIGGRQATIDFAAQFEIAPGLHLLDVGSGQGARPASGAQPARRAFSLPARLANTGSCRRRSWSTRSSWPSALPNTRWPTRVITSCSTRSGARASRKQTAKRRTKPMPRSVIPSSSAPAFEVIAPPSKPATTARLSTGANSNSAGLHSVGIGAPSASS